MQEYFTWLRLPFYFLFERWNVTTSTILIFTALAVFAVAVLFEGLRIAKMMIHKAFFTLPLVVKATPGDSESAPTIPIYVTDSLNYARKQRIKNHILQSLVHVIKVILSYGLMLAVMTYNGFIVAAIVAGATLGYFVFCHRIGSALRRGPVTISRATTTTTCNIGSNEPSVQSLLVEAGKSQA